jgi:hypothetical protein
MAKARDGDVPDISGRTAGEFYLAAEGMPSRKISTPLSPSHHARGPLTIEEVVDRARSENATPDQFEEPSRRADIKHHAAFSHQRVEADLNSHLADLGIRIRR